MPSLRSGFTIVELLIVIVVIGILAAITTIVFNSVTTRAVDSAIATDLRNAAIKMNRYKIDKGSWPSTWEEAVPPGQFGGSASEEYALRVAKRTNYTSIPGQGTSQNALALCGYGRPANSPSYFGTSNSEGLIIVGISARSNKVFAVTTESNSPKDITSSFSPTTDANVCNTAGQALDVKIGFQWFLYPYVGSNS